MSKSEKQMSLVELAFLVTKLRNRIDNLSLVEAANPEMVQRIYDECRAEAVSDSAGINASRDSAQGLKFPNIGTIPPGVDYRFMHRLGKPKKVLSKENYRKLNAGRDAYFKKMGYGRFSAKRSVKKAVG